MPDEMILQEPSEAMIPAMPEPPAQLPEIGEKEARRRFGRIGFALLAMVALQQGCAVGLMLLINSFPALEGNNWLPILANFLPLYLLAFPAFLLIVRGLQPMPRVGEKRRVSGHVIVKSTFASYAVMIACNLAVGVGLYSLIAMLKGSETVNPLTTMVLDGNPFAVLPFVVLGAPLLEDYIFRGVMLKHLGAVGAKPYILVSAVAFALFHANLAQIPYAFAMGLVLAGMTYYSGTIKYAVITHMAINFIDGGLPVLLMQLGSTGEAITGIMAFVFAGLGIAAAILLLRGRKKLDFAPAAAQLPKGVMFRNAGVILFIAVLAALTVAVLLM
jgi:membrane protease YdiL (CAAX protease family)